MAQIRREELWRIQYREDRYLRDIPTPDLLTRAGDLMSAMLRYESDGRIGIESINVAEISRMERLAHALEEMRLRGLSHRQAGIQKALNVPQPEKVREALKVLASTSFRAGEPILVKFGKREHMSALFFEGKGRVSPASYYDDPSLGRARADIEGRMSAFLNPVDAHRYMGVRQDGNGSSAVNIDVPYLGSTQIELYSKTDFYVYCMAEACDARLFEDFGADACVLITNPTAFKTRLAETVGPLLPEWTYFDTAVDYFDPFFARPHQMAPQLAKHFRFSYQKEYRLLWIPPCPEDVASLPQLDHLPFNIGPLTSFARLINL
jgi:hypothetical protein